MDVVGTEGRASAWDNGQLFRTWRPAKGDNPARDMSFTPEGDSPTICTIRDIIHEMETGEITGGNIDVTMNSMEVMFGLVESHLQGGARVTLPIQNRSVYIPGR